MESIWKGGHLSATWLIVTNVTGGVTSCLGFVGMWLAGNRRRIGWAIALGSEVLWVVYSLLLHQPALLPFCLMWGAVYWRNYRRWDIRHG